MPITDGVININKPRDWTSQDVCAKLRSRLHIRKTGHTGTLDPMATGVLPVCIGKATRIIEYYDSDFKSYHAGMKLGISTDTLDITGEILETGDFRGVTENAVREAFRALTGTVSQVPPKYSALRINGKRAYELAREGKDFELKSRTVEIPYNEISMFDAETGTVEFDVRCSKGTYIRSICDDIGRALGCGAVMTSLERTASGYFRVEDSVDIRALTEMSDEEIAERVIPADRTLISLGSIELNDKRLIAFINGNPSDPWAYAVSADPASEGSGRGEKSYKVYSRGRFLGIARIKDGSLVPQKVFASL